MMEMASYFRVIDEITAVVRSRAALRVITIQPGAVLNVAPGLHGGGVVEAQYEGGVVALSAEDLHERSQMLS